MGESLLQSQEHELFLQSNAVSFRGAFSPQTHETVSHGHFSATAERRNFLEVYILSQSPSVTAIYFAIHCLSSLLLVLPNLPF